MRKKHYNIPVFIPHAACPHDCIFCNQKEISGTKSLPDDNDIIDIIETRLDTIPRDSHIEIAFFGGSFTGLPLKIQKRYLSLVSPFIDEDRIHSVRLSTRPDYISIETLDLLKLYHVKTIELGAQSMDDDVLKLSERGHTAHDVESASLLINKMGFDLGLQMMIGLPGDTFEKSIYTAEKIKNLAAKCVRIYPALVIKDTKLEKMYKEYEYLPLSLEDAVCWSSAILQIFESSGIQVIRLGLHPGEELISGNSLIAGPFHVSFRELVYTKIWGNIFEKEVSNINSSNLSIHVSPKELNYAVGYNSKNKHMLLQKFRTVNFRTDPALKGREIIVDYC